MPVLPDWLRDNCHPYLDSVFTRRPGNTNRFDAQSSGVGWSEVRNFLIQSTPVPIKFANFIGPRCRWDGPSPALSWVRVNCSPLNKCLHTMPWKHQSVKGHNPVVSEWSESKPKFPYIVQLKKWRKSKFQCIPVSFFVWPLWNNYLLHSWILMRKFKIEGQQAFAQGEPPARTPLNLV